MKKNGGTGVSTGGVSLLVIFVLLCLTAFAVLSLVSAQADRRMTERTADSVTNYYAADSAAEETLAAIRRSVEQSRAEQDGLSFAQRSARAVRADVPGVSAEPADGGGVVFSYDTPIDENRTLYVSVAADDAGGYRITRWQTVFTGEWQPDSSLELAEPEK